MPTSTLIKIIISSKTFQKYNLSLVASSVTDPGLINLKSFYKIKIGLYLVMFFHSTSFSAKLG